MLKYGLGEEEILEQLKYKYRGRYRISVNRFFFVLLSQNWYRTIRNHLRISASTYFSITGLSQDPTVFFHLKLYTFSTFLHTSLYYFKTFNHLTFYIFFNYRASRFLSSDIAACDFSEFSRIQIIPYLNTLRRLTQGQR